MTRDMTRRTRQLIVLAVLLACAAMAGCATVGHEFPVNKVRSLEIGQTTKEQVYDMFGPPWRTGIEDGLKTWTYAHYKKSTSQTLTRDLVIRFNEQGKVGSYTFNSNYPEDREL